MNRNPGRQLYKKFLDVRRIQDLSGITWFSLRDVLGVVGIMDFQEFIQDNRDGLPGLAGVAVHEGTGCRVLLLRELGFCASSDFSQENLKRSLKTIRDKLIAFSPGAVSHDPNPLLTSQDTFLEMLFSELWMPEMPKKVAELRRLVVDVLNLYIQPPTRL